MFHYYCFGHSDIHHIKGAWIEGKEAFANVVNKDGDWIIFNYWFQIAWCHHIMGIAFLTFNYDCLYTQAIKIYYFFEPEFVFNEVSVFSPCDGLHAVCLDMVKLCYSCSTEETLGFLPIWKFSLLIVVIWLWLKNNVLYYERCYGNIYHTVFQMQGSCTVYCVLCTVYCV